MVTCPTMRQLKQDELDFWNRAQKSKAMSELSAANLAYMSEAMARQHAHWDTCPVCWGDGALERKNEDQG